MRSLSFQKKLVWITLFSIAMGFLEAAVVIYLRKIYYPGGFDFPLVPVEPSIAVVEFLREAATILMLAGIGVLAGRNSSDRFAGFIFSFAIWDIFYYVFLKLFLNWPAGITDWDILFLIPVPWVGPVLAPCIVSLSMIIFALLIMYATEKDRNYAIGAKVWLFFSVGCFVIIASFIHPYLAYLRQEHTSAWMPSSEKDLFEEIKHFVPVAYNWWLFVLGQLLVLTGILIYAHRTRSNKKQPSPF